MSDNDKKPKKKIKSIRDVIIESIECEPGVEGCTADPETCPNAPNQCDKKLSMFGYYDDTIKDSVENVLCNHMGELNKTFSQSARRWEMIVYPSLFAFILLASYGFFLIYSLTNDVSIVASEMREINTNMHHVVNHMSTVSNNMVDMTKTLNTQSLTMQEMNHHVKNMSVSMGQMRYEIAVMNSSISRPMQFMNDFMPW